MSERYGLDKPAAMGGRMSLVQRMMFRVLQAVLAIVSKLYVRWRVIGGENLPDDGPYIVCPVHRSYVDTPLVGVVTTKRFRFMGKETLWSNRVGGWFLSAMGGFPVERGTADRAALRGAEAVLARGEPLVMFPEGTRREGPVVRPELMHEGPSFLAGRQQVPIVPVGIGGTAKVMPPGSSMLYPRKVVFIFGEPIAPPSQVNGRVPRSAVREHAELLRQRIQELYDAAQAAAG